MEGADGFTPTYSPSFFALPSASVCGSQVSWATPFKDIAAAQETSAVFRSMHQKKKGNYAEETDRHELMELGSVSVH